MSTLFLIGNGFDVNCGMKTRYVDVYEGYVKEPANTEVLKKFKETISSDIENWGDFEMAMTQYAECLEGEDEFLECVRDFAKYMENYLIDELSAFRMKLDDRQILDAVISEVTNSFSTFYSGISHNVDEIMENRKARVVGNIDVISFNYTDAFDILWYKYIDKTPFTRKAIIHIHGILNDDPVFGVDNVNQIKTDYSLSRKGKRGFVKPIFNEAYDRQRIQHAKNLIDNAKTICVYGMSLGESDLSWRNELVEWLGKSEDNHLIIYQYSLSGVEYRTVSEKMDIEEAEKERLLSEWNVDSADSVFEQVHIPCGKNIFNIQKVIEIVERERNEKKQRELEEKIELGKEFIEQHLQDTVILG